MLRTYLLPTLIALGALLQVSPARLHAWRLDDSRLQAAALPAQMTPISSPAQGDFQGNGQLESLRLTNGQARLLNGQEVLWQSPRDWQVTQALIADLVHSGHPQAVLLVWRPIRPWSRRARTPRGRC